VTRKSTHDEVGLAHLLRLLPPAPEAWVTAASELPRLQTGLDHVLALADADAEFRQALLKDPETALTGAGVEPEPRVVERIRSRLEDRRHG
jgi:hypothetical protein